MKNNTKLKLIAASVALMTSFGSFAGLGGLNVQSNLGEPFSGTVTVTGEEARILLNGGKVNLSDNRLGSSVRKSGDNAVVSIRSKSAVQDPVLVFQLGVGTQSRQYTAIIDPPGYGSNNGGRSVSPFDPKAARDRVAAVVGGSNISDGKKTAPSQAAAHSTDKKIKTAKNTEHTQTRTEPRRAMSGNYTVRQGETLTGIAARVRPNGMTTYQTVQALVTANPNLFTNGNADQIWPGNVLNIPSAAQLRRLAQQPAAMPSETPAVTTTPATTAQAASEAATDMASAAASMPVVTQADTAASAPVSMASDMPASDVAVAAASSETAVSEPMASSEAKPAEASAMPAVDDTASGSWWRWLLLAGAGALALWLVGKSLGNRKKAVVATPNAEDGTFDVEETTPVEVAVKEERASADEGIRTHQPIVRPSNTAPLTRAEAAATLTAAKAASGKQSKAKAEDELSVEDDFEDDIFFTEVTETEVPKADNFRLDLGNIDSQQSGIVSGAVTLDEETQKRKNADWDRIESTESVYEPEDSSFNHIAELTDAPSDLAENVSFAEEFASVESVAETTMPAMSAVEPVVEATVPAMPVVEPVAETTVQVAPKAEPLEWTVDEPEVPEFVESEKKHETEELPALEFDAPISEPVVEAAVPVGEAVEWPSKMETAEAVVAEGEIAVQDADDWLKDIPAESVADSTIEWDDSIHFDESSITSTAANVSEEGNGFLSESVGMTAPLEAKYELAKMYIEIGDPDAARDTLMELMEESDGNILSKAEALLKELGN
ncbi:hypothetical protein PL75_08495 [Neisseria arctica]|uniref:LysM domain-containing protein n=1 Tax=Neisseria arctica TaxID=1470200 RepID=A0A0J0YQN3_9NEIS|nr:FimV/HubP family polar landmark protein [Neisseria arctica]KLT72424.1 hypothetical protein PL75_08495 [Neisseria arctica]UOO86002.1 LysM peptidoglycan-binding domain-containing protein [Neisseria arctica]